MRPHSLLKTALIIPLALGIACSDPEPEDKPIVLPEVDMAKPSADMAQDMLPVDMPPPDDMQPEGPPHEQEPNDLSADANPLDLTKGVQGVIDEMTLTHIDVDAFSFEAKANTIINFEFETGPAFKTNGKRGLLARISNGDDSSDFIVLTEHYVGRSFYVAYDQTYTMYVQQLEAHVRSENIPVPPHGGPDAYYKLKATITELAATEPALELNKLYASNNTDGEPDVYPFTLTEQTHITTFVRRKIDMGQLNRSRSNVVNATTRAPMSPVFKSYAEKDEDGHWVSGYEYILSPGDYFMVVDNSFNPRVADYELMVRKHDGTIDLPQALGLDSPYQGAVDPYFGENTYRDNDVFSFSLEPGEQSVITVAAEQGSEPVGGFWSYISQNGYYENLSRAEGREGQLTASVYNPDGPNAKRQEYIVRLDINDQPRQPDKDYNYTISRTLVPAPTTLLATKNIRIDDLMFMPGLPIWFEINIPKDHLWTLDLAQDSLFPVDYLLIREDRVPLTLAGGTFNHPARNQPASYLTTSNERVLLGVFPSLWLHDSAERFSRVFRAVDLSALTYAEIPAMVAHTNKETAFALDVTAPVLVKGNLPNMPAAPAADFYKVTLEAGQTISIITEPDPNPALQHAPVELYIYDESDKLVAIQSGVFGDAPDDDVIAYLGNGATILGTYASTIFSAPADGTYTIELIGKASSSLLPGPYVLKVAPATLDPLITNP